MVNACVCVGVCVCVGMCVLDTNIHWLGCVSALTNIISVFDTK